MVSLQNCHYVDIENSTNLKDRWEEIKEKENHQKVVYTSGTVVNSLEEKQHAARVGLFYRLCKEQRRFPQDIHGFSLSTEALP